MIDITPFFNWFVSEFLKLFTFIFNTLDSISFLGITLLDFLITITILAAALPLVVTLLTTRSVEVRQNHPITRDSVRNKADKTLAKVEKKLDTMDLSDDMRM